MRISWAHAHSGSSGRKRDSLNLFKIFRDLRALPTSVLPFIANLFLYSILTIKNSTLSLHKISLELFCRKEMKFLLFRPM